MNTNKIFLGIFLFSNIYSAPLTITSEPLGISIITNAMCGVVTADTPIEYVIFNNLVIGSGISDAVGQWSYLPKNGTFTLSAVEYNSDGSTTSSSNSQTGTVTFDITDTSCTASTSNFFMNVAFNSPQMISGTATPNSRVVITINGTQIKSLSTTATSLGLWSIVLPNTGGAVTEFNVIETSNNAVLESQQFLVGVNAPLTTTVEIPDIQTVSNQSIISTAIDNKYTCS